MLLLPVVLLLAAASDLHADPYANSFTSSHTNYNRYSYPYRYKTPAPVNGSYPYWHQYPYSHRNNGSYPYSYRTPSYPYSHRHNGYYPYWHRYPYTHRHNGSSRYPYSHRHNGSYPYSYRTPYPYPYSHRYNGSYPYWHRYPYSHRTPYYPYSHRHNGSYPYSYRRPYYPYYPYSYSHRYNGSYPYWHQYNTPAPDNGSYPYWHRHPYSYPYRYKTSAPTDGSYPYSYRYNTPAPGLEPEGVPGSKQDKTGDKKVVEVVSNEETKEVEMRLAGASLKAIRRSMGQMEERMKEVFNTNQVSCKNICPEDDGECQPCGENAAGVRAVVLEAGEGAFVVTFKVATAMPEAETKEVIRKNGPAIARLAGATYVYVIVPEGDDNDDALHTGVIVAIAVGGMAMVVAVVAVVLVVTMKKKEQVAEAAPKSISSEPFE